MNRKNLTAAVLAGLAGAAGIAGTAQAVNVNPDGLGQVLIYPYYTVNAGNATLLSVVNTTEDSKAVKVRFLEGQNSEEVLDFNLYLSPYDVWTGAVVNDEGTPTLLSGDNSCSVPWLARDYPEQPFLTLALPGTDSDTSIGRTTEGYVEVIEMGSMDPTTGFGADVVHKQHGETSDPFTSDQWAPADCDALIASWTDNTDPSKRGDWIKEWYETGGEPDSYGYDDIETPSGGLFGGASIVNVNAGTLYTYDARALNGFDNNEDGKLHARPGFIHPNLGDGSGEFSHTGYVFADNGGSINAGFEDSIDAVSYVFMHDTVMNEYIVDNVAAETEWVLTFPTKHFYVNDDHFDTCAEYSEDPEDPEGPQICTATRDVRAPFTDAWDGSTACEAVTLDTVWDQDERGIKDPNSPPGTPIPPVVSPSEPGSFGGEEGLPFELCYEAQVVRFSYVEDASGWTPPTDVLGANNAVNFNTYGDWGNGTAGWARVNLHTYRLDDNGSGNPGEPDGVINEDDTLLQRGALGNLVGLPVTGFSVNRFQNNFISTEGAIANYGGIFDHKGTRKQCYGECQAGPAQQQSSG